MSEERGLERSRGFSGSSSAFIDCMLIALIGVKLHYIECSITGDLFGHRYCLWAAAVY